MQRLLLAGVEASGGFVEQQHGGIGRQRACDLDQALMAIAEARDRLVGAVPQPDEVERGAGAAPQRVACRARSARCHPVRRRRRRSPARSSTGTGECSGTCARGRRWCACARAGGDVDAVDENLRRGRAIEAGHDIERRRLAAAVGADQRMHSAAPHLKSTPSTALRPPKCLHRPLTSSAHRRAGIGAGAA